jgi:hypothetical protein
MVRQETKTVRPDFDFAIPGATAILVGPLNIEVSLK